MNTQKTARRAVVIADLPVREKNLTSEEMRIVRGSGPGGSAATKPGLDGAQTQKWPSDGDDDLPDDF